MRESTARWLEPLETAARQGNLDLVELMHAASMPVDESPAGNTRLATLIADVEGSEAAAVDWLRYGMLIRLSLGGTWLDYPESPEDD